MGGQQPDADRPKRRLRIGPGIVALFFGGIFAIAVFFSGALSRESHDPPSLCDMLRSGWTTDEIVDSDQWRDWPDSMSRTERGMTVLHEAGRECPKLVGL